MSLELYSNRRFMVFNVSELPNIDFSQVLETSEDTVIKSCNELKTFVKWDGNTPSSVNDLLTKEGPYSYNEMVNILENEEWVITGSTLNIIKFQQ